MYFHFSVLKFICFAQQPDITAPGLNILAAWSEASSPTKLEADKRVVKYNILSGTSMSCPHIGGAAALLKAIHPRWSSAAIRSALITSGEQIHHFELKTLHLYSIIICLTNKQLKQTCLPCSGTEQQSG